MPTSQPSHPAHPAHRFPCLLLLPPQPLMRAAGKGSHRTDFAILDRVSGIVRPGVFTLLLGPPGSGCVRSMHSGGGGGGGLEVPGTRSLARRRTACPAVLLGPVCEQTRSSP